MKRIAIFCGSSAGLNPVFEKLAFEVGAHLASQHIEVVYGGGAVGLMGAVADGALSKNGNVIGVLPTFLNAKEIAHTSLTDLIIVDTMHERKLRMLELSDGAITLPGGFGTFEELFEYITWAQLGLHKNPVGLLNIAGYYDQLILQIQHMVDQAFLKEINKNMLLQADNIQELLANMHSYVAPDVQKWITKETS